MEPDTERNFENRSGGRGIRAKEVQRKKKSQNNYDVIII